LPACHPACCDTLPPSWPTTTGSSCKPPSCPPCPGCCTLLARRLPAFCPDVGWQAPHTLHFRRWFHLPLLLYFCRSTDATPAVPWDLDTPHLTGVAHCPAFCCCCSRHLLPPLTLLGRVPYAYCPACTHVPHHGLPTTAVALPVRRALPRTCRPLPHGCHTAR